MTNAHDPRTLEERLEWIANWSEPDIDLADAGTAREALDKLNQQVAEIARLKLERNRAVRAYNKLVKRITPKRLRYAPKDRLIIGVERPPCEDDTFFYDIIWSEDHGAFMSGFYPLSHNGASHFIDPHDMIGIVSRRERKS
ncbi:hypothetical protein SAMN02927924_01390 [Sphingobium faniae]|nr:hypothetical protein SAMN02927924_01390 [Sphingobium faniae]